MDTDESDNHPICLFKKLGSPIGYNECFITNSYYFIKLTPNILHLLNPSYTWILPEEISSIKIIDIKKPQFIIATKHLLFLINIDTNNNYSIINKDSNVYKSLYYQYENISLFYYGRKKILSLKLNPFSISVLRIGKNNKIKRKKRIENYILDKYISYSCLIQCKNTNNLSDSLILSQELYESLFGLNSSLKNENILLLGCFCGSLLSIIIPNDRIQNPIHTEILSMNESILKILSTKLNPNNNKGDDILIIIGIYGSIRILQSNNIPEYPNIKSTYFHLNTKIQDIFITNLSTLIYLSYGKIYYVDIINQEINSDNIIIYSLNTLLFPIQFNSNLYFKTIGYINSSSSWYTLDSKGNCYCISLLSCKSLQEYQNNINSFDKTKIKYLVSKLTKLSESQQEITKKEKYLDSLLTLSGLLCRIKKNNINPFTCNIKINRNIEHSIIHIEDSLSSFIIELLYSGNENLCCNYWRCKIQFQCITTSNTTLILPSKWYENTFSFIINNPINISMIQSSLTVYVSILLNIPNYPSSVIFSSSHTFTMLDFHNININNTQISNYSIQSSLDNMHYSLYHNINNIKQSSKQIQLTLTSPISTSLQSSDIIQLLYHQPINIKEYNKDIIQSTCQTKYKHFQTTIKSIIDTNTKLPLILLSCDCSKQLYSQLRISILTSVLALYPKIEKIFWKHVLSNNINDTHLDIIYKQLNDSLLSLPLVQYQSLFIHLKSQLQKIKETSVLLLSTIEYYNLQEELFKLYFDFRNKLQNLVY